MAKHKQASAVCEKESGLNYEWITSVRGQLHLLKGFQSMDRDAAVKYCRENKGRLVEPGDESDIKLLVAHMVATGLDSVWVGINFDQSQDR